jgi:flagellar biosynthesis/type III secretory pathway protein FliH
MKKILIVTIFLIFIVSFPVMISANDEVEEGSGTMPDSPLYFLKIWYEKIVTFISFGDAKKAERYNELAEKRLYEAEKMAKKGKESLTQKLLEEYEKNLDKALAKIEEMKEEAERKAKEKAKQKINEKINEVLKKISESTIKNQEALQKVYNLVPDTAKEAVGTVIEITKTAFEYVAGLIKK